MSHILSTYSLVCTHIPGTGEEDEACANQVIILKEDFPLPANKVKSHPPVAGHGCTQHSVSTQQSQGAAAQASAGQRELRMTPTSQSGHKPRSNPAYKEGSARPCHTTMSKVKLRGLRFFDPHVSMRREHWATLLFPLSTIQEGHRGIEYTPECLGSRFHTAPPRLPKQTRQLPTKPTLSRNSAPN